MQIERIRLIESVKCPYYSKSIFPNLDNSKIFTNVTGPYVKLDKKDDGVVVEDGLKLGDLGYPNCRFLQIERIR